MEQKLFADTSGSRGEKFGWKAALCSLSGVYIYDLERGTNIFINPEYTHLTGYTLEDLKGLNRAEFFALFHPEDQARVSAHRQRLAQAPEDEVLAIDYRFKRADGQWIWYRSRDTVLERKVDGPARLLVGAVLDLSTHQTIASLEQEIVEHKRDRTRLEQLSRVYRDAADPILIEDLSGNILDINREAERAYGWSKTELVGKSVKSLLLPERYQFAWKLRERCLNGQEVRNWEGVRVDRYGRSFPVLVTVFPLLDENGGVESLATITKDISLLKNMESELRESRRRVQDLSRKSIEALEVDRKTVSRELHDSIGGNLSAIKFALEAAAQMIAPTPDAAAESLKKTIAHLAATIKECKRLSVSLRPSVLDDMGLISTIDWHARQVGQQYSRIRILQQIDVKEHDIPESFKIVIYRVIQEALSNATRHSQADKVYIRLKRSGHYLETEIEDNGRGFERKQVSGPEDHLSGWGLKSMQERVEIIGGSFSIQSLSGLGTHIRILLPMDEE
jgi:PAS domain S-box-containing protein